MIVVGAVAVLSTAGLLALAMVLRGSVPYQRPELLAAVADVIRAWRFPGGDGSTPPCQQAAERPDARASVDRVANVGPTPDR